jgi:hypothetical protein
VISFHIFIFQSNSIYFFLLALPLNPLKSNISSSSRPTLSSLPSPAPAPASVVDPESHADASIPMPTSSILSASNSLLTESQREKLQNRTKNVPEMYTSKGIPYSFHISFLTSTIDPSLSVPNDASLLPLSLAPGNRNVENILTEVDGEKQDFSKDLLETEEAKNENQTTILSPMVTSLLFNLKSVRHFLSAVCDNPNRESALSRCEKEDLKNELIILKGAVEAKLKLLEEDDLTGVEL